MSRAVCIKTKARFISQLAELAFRQTDIEHMRDYLGPIEGAANEIYQATEYEKGECPLGRSDIICFCTC